MYNFIKWSSASWNTSNVHAMYLISMCVHDFCYNKKRDIMM